MPRRCQPQTHMIMQDIHGQPWPAKTGKDDGKPTTEYHQILAHCGTILEVVYTNEEDALESNLARFERLLDDEKDRFVGFDMEYTPIAPNSVALVQIAVREQVLLFHWCRSSQTNRARALLQDFLSTKKITFASVDIWGDKGALRESGFSVPQDFHLDIQEEFYNLKQGKIGMATLAEHIIDSSYSRMKKNFPSELHGFWEYKPLNRQSLQYAAIDGYVSYRLYSTIKDMKDSLGSEWQEHSAIKAMKRELQATATMVRTESSLGAKYKSL